MTSSEFQCLVFFKKANNMSLIQSCHQLAAFGIFSITLSQKSQGVDVVYLYVSICVHYICD